MKYTGRYMVMILLLLIVVMQLIFQNTFAQSLSINFEQMKGTLFTHAITDKSDSLSSQEITELRDEKGVPLWFSRDFCKKVCLTGLCRMVRVRIYWTGAATYLGLQSPVNDPLTKNDHSGFKPEDYKNLDRILSDSLSILKGLKIEDLTVKTENKNKIQVDVYSGATQPSISEFVVKDAVYTCYTLWHTVYGSTCKNIMFILDQRTGNDYLRLVFDRKDPKYSCWAIDFIKRHPRFHPAFYNEIMNLIKSEDTSLSQKALYYFTPSVLSDAAIQKELVKFMEEIASKNKFEIIGLFSALLKVDNETILLLLDQFANQKISVGLLGYVCRLIRPENMENMQIVAKIKSISEDKNQYVKNITQKLLTDSRN